MNKQTYPFLLSALALGLAGILSGCLVGCTKNPIELLSCGSPTLQVSAGVGTKAVGGVYWDKDSIGVIVTDPESYAEKYTNVGYCTESEGENGVRQATFKALDGEIWFVDTSELTLTSYAPYDSSLGTDGLISQTTEFLEDDGLKKRVDFLYASGYSASEAKPTVNFTYDHKMARIILDIRPGDMNPEHTELVATATYTLSGLIHEGTFNALTGETNLKESAEPCEDWDLKSRTTHSDLTDDDGTVVGVSDTIIAYPQNPTELTIATTIAGLSYDGTIDSPEGGFASGYSYTYKVSVNETKLEVSGCTITRWRDPEVDDWGTYGPIGSYVYPDEEFQLIFNDTPSLGSEGKISIYDYETDEVVDYIDMADVLLEMNDPTTITSSGSGYTFNTAMDVIYAYPQSSANDRVRYRPVHYNPVTLDEATSTVTIRHHFGVLEHEKKYYITVDASCFSSGGDVQFDGIGKKEWIIVIKPAPSSTTEVAVGKYGYDVDFRTVQGALGYVVGNSTYGNSTAATVNVHEGTYEEFITVTYMSGPLTIRSVDGNGAAIITQASTDDLNDGTGPSDGTNNSNSVKPEFGQTGCLLSGGRVVFYTQSCSCIEILGMTVENTYEVEDDLPSAEAVYFNSDDSRITVCRNCTFRGHHSVVETKGYNWFYNCTVEGSTSAVWGYPICSLFEDCELRSVACQTETNKSICESRSKSGNLGFCFLNCDITASSEVASDSKWILAGITAQKTDTYDGYDEDGNAAKLYYVDNMAFVDCTVDTDRFYGWGISTNATRNDPDYGNPLNPPDPTTGEGDGWKYYGFKGYTVPASGTSAYNGGNWSYAYEITNEDPDYEYSSWFSDRNRIFSKFAADYGSSFPFGATDWSSFFTTELARQ